MVCPWPSLSPSRPMLTPDAAPGTTTWTDSNSFWAAAIFAVVGAFAGACAAGRIFWDAGATQTWAAEADAVTNRVANRGSVFKLCLLGWLLPGTTSADVPGSPTEEASPLFHGRCAAPCPNKGASGEDGALRACFPTAEYSGGLRATPAGSALWRGRRGYRSCTGERGGPRPRKRPAGPPLARCFPHRATRRAPAGLH